MPKKIKDPVLLEPNEDLSIASNEVYVGGDEIAVLGIGGGHTIKVAGTARSDMDGISLGSGNTVADNVVKIASTGLVKSVDFSGLSMNGSGNTIVNKGTIESVAGNAAVNINSSAGADSTTITNSGSILGGIYIGTNDVVEFTNTGTLRADQFAYNVSFSDAHVDRITNQGKIFGAVLLGFGDDVYNGKSGMVRGDVLGGDGEDRLTGGKENNNIRGENGQDRLQGGHGADTLSGGLDADIYVYTSVEDSLVKASGRDLIMDFVQSQGDILDLRDIDAKEGKKNDQSFRFIGDESFHNKAGELRYELKSGDTVISGDTDGDGKADFAIRLFGEVVLVAEDFML